MSIDEQPYSILEPSEDYDLVEPPTKLTRSNTNITLQNNYLENSSSATSPETLASLLDSGESNCALPPTVIDVIKVEESRVEKKKSNKLFQDEKLITFSNLSHEYKVTMLLMALQLFDQVSLVPSAKPAQLYDYAVNLAKSYDVKSFDTYSLLIQRASRVIHQLKEFKLRPAELPFGSDVCTVEGRSLTSEQCLDPLNLQVWVQNNLNHGIENLMLHNFGSLNASSFVQIVSSWQGQEAVAQERNLLSYFWDDERFEADLRQNNCKVDLAIFRSFSSTPRAVFLAHVARIGALIQEIILNGIPNEVKSRIINSVMCLRQADGRVSRFTTPCCENQGNIYCTPPIALNELRDGFSLEISRLMKEVLWENSALIAQSKLAVQAAVQFAVHVLEKCSKFVASCTHHCSATSTTLEALVSGTHLNTITQCADSDCMVCRPLRRLLIGVNSKGSCHIIQYI
ncbi:uncharacterized protein SAPINGB_P002720 [Magnusiomyces paraingens]|uniref:Uncharacterized protein n=1 Tax=Magnusiomyces paraingens TaxID=2606893 RepID=A0A5E8BHK4_9ASCO|nr:uncharacterized protein SAPINGB_P002720 [Saprochaete ingens]VVT50352.1 unnamed protein product [Saprochaete ingens]